ncbi:MAG: NRDE family protein [Planctomycetaceae bacterium]|nr:NRDE family protein [Planctomycetaceae bacterium]
MGILAIQYQMLPDSPFLLALNREEYYTRPSLGPKIQSGRPRVVCGVDKKAGGTWAGVNQFGLFVAVINCPKRKLSDEPRSRGILCKELLQSRDAEEALQKAYVELSGGNYDGGNFFCADRFTGGVVYGGDELEIEHLRPGFHVLSENRLNDRDDERQELVRRMMTLQRIDSAISFMAIASKTLSKKPDSTGKHGVIVSESTYGTVSSMLLSLTDKSQRSMMQFVSGPPSEKPYEDVSALLRQVLSTERSFRNTSAAEKQAEKAAGGS